MIVEADLQELIDNEVREDKMIDYKRDMIGHREEDKKEYCRDVSSFANDSGGHLIIGIDEEHAVAKRLSGLVVV
ncbi:MAG: ATP-binding protein [Candidatus Nitrosopolaris sp.]